MQNSSAFQYLATDTIHESATNPRRLLNYAKANGRPFSEALQYYAIERFLYRLSVSPHVESFILKGALLLTAWQAPISRPTMDIDEGTRLKLLLSLLQSTLKNPWTTSLDLSQARPICSPHRPNLYAKKPLPDLGRGLPFPIRYRRISPIVAKSMIATPSTSRYSRNAM